MQHNLCFSCMGQLPSPDAKCPHCGHDNKNTSNGPGMLPGGMLAGKYVTGKLLGRGGFGATYIGYDLLMQRTVAIKEYLPTQLVTRGNNVSLLTVITGGEGAFAKGREQALTEGRMAAGLGHVPGVVQIFDVVSANNTIYIIMEYIKGKTLSHYIRGHQGKLAPSDVIPLLEDVVGALSTLHKGKVIHRDVKPDNIMLRSEGQRSVLLDFGAARIEDENTISNSSAVVSPGYAPPEQYESTSLDGRIDQYSLAATIYFMLTGMRPADAILRLVNNNAVPSIRSQNSSVKDAVEQVIMKGMSVKAADRYDTVDEFWAALKNAIEGKRDPSIMPRKTKRNGRILAAAAALAMVAAGAWLLLRETHCNHQWNITDCTMPAICSLCGEEQDEAPGHTWLDATCETPVTCSRCGFTKGNALGHAWTNATCETPATCNICGITDDEALGHVWQDATCETPSTCSICGLSDGEALGHTWLDAICESPAICSICGLTEGNAPGHSWVTSSCTSPMICNLCGEKGEIPGHAWEEATCQDPKTCRKCRATEGDIQDHKWWIYSLNSQRKCQYCSITEPWLHLNYHTFDAGYINTIAITTDNRILLTGKYPANDRSLLEWENIIQVSAGQNHAVALRNDGTVLATGDNTKGQCNVEDWTDIVYVSAGTNYTLGLKADGTVVGVGINNFGQRSVDSWTNIVKIAAGDKHALGLKADGTVVAAGFNTQGQCNVGEWQDIIDIDADKFSVGLKNDGTVLVVYDDATLPDVSDWSNITSVVTGGNLIAGLRSNGKIVAEEMQGNDDHLPNDWKDIVAVSAGKYHIVGQKSDGSLVAQGYSPYGQCDVAKWSASELTHPKALRSASSGNALMSLQMMPRSNFIDVSEKHAVGLKMDGTVLNTVNGSNTDAWTDIIQVAAGAHYQGDEQGPFTIGLKADGTVVAEGSNMFAQCNVEHWTDIIQIDAGYAYTVGLRADGTVVATGDNRNNQLTVRSWTNIVQVAAGEEFTVGVKTDGTVETAGKSQSATKGVKEWTGITQVAVGERHIVGLKSDGTVVAAGNNTHGRCDVEGWTDIIQVAAGGHHTVGLRADGTVVAVGDTAGGFCDVGDWTDVVAISASERYTVGLRADGSVLVAGKKTTSDRDNYMQSVFNAENWHLFNTEP